MNYFGELSPRMRDFREELVTLKPLVCAERARIVTDAYRKYQDQPMVLRRALIYKHVLEGMSIFIEPQTLLAGNQASRNRSAPIFPEYAMDWVIAELDEFDQRSGDRFYLTLETKEILRELAPFWERNTLKDRGLAAMPASAKLFYDLGIIQAEGNLSSGGAHLAVNYRRMLNHGLREYQERAEQRLAKLDLTDYRNLAKSYFYRAVILVIDATRAFAKRYAEKALCLARTETDPKHKTELLEMNRVLNQVPYEKAGTFYEAVQSLWLVHLCLHIESNGHSLSYGRMDQYLYPFYAQDLAAGRITEEGACELLTNLWLKTFSINQIQSWSQTRFSVGNPLCQNVTIGGQLLDAADPSHPRDAVNPLSYLILRSVAQTRLPQPNLTVRYHRGLDDRFMDTCIEVLRLGFGMPGFNNDEIIIPSFISQGVKPEDAYDYSAVGGAEVAVPGKWGYRCTSKSFLNFPKSLLIALNDGVDTISGTRLCKGVGHFRDMRSFDQVMQAWDRIIRVFARQSVIIDAVADTALEQDAADVLCSALGDDCIERGQRLNEGGAVYDFTSDLQVGIANLADSLAAIKQCVFEDRSMSPAELWAAMEANFEGPEHERIRRLVLDAPKYGNDDDFVDLLIRQAYQCYIDEMKRHRNTRYGRGPIGGAYYAGTSTGSAHIPQGAGTPATPDGRKAGEPLAEGCAPSRGMDRKGPAAVCKSVSKLPAAEILGGVLLNQKLAPQMVEHAEDRQKLISLIRAFFDQLGGFHVQFNLVSRETLRAAQARPEKYRNLIVRVAGYSAFFNALSRETQDDIIERTEQVW
jgi:formate C-acetyltransferase